MKKSELELARQIIDSLAGEFEPDALVSEYRRDLKALLEAKTRGEEIVAPEPAETRTGPRPHGGAQGERRRGEEAPGRGAGCEARASAQGPKQGELAPSARSGRSVGQEEVEAPAPTASSDAWKRVLSIFPW